MAAVAIVIPTWNRAALLAEALESLARQTYPIDRVIVVDNGSTDDSAAIAARAGAQVISLGRNAGFSSGGESGHSRSRRGAEWIGVLNNDVTLERRIGWHDSMAKLEPAARHGLRPASFWMRGSAIGWTARSTRFAGVAAPGGAGTGAWILRCGTSPETYS